MKKKKIVVIGGGFAGLNFIQNLNDNAFEITLIDKQNHHQFQPLFYQVATARLEPSSISFPFRAVLKKRNNVRFLFGEVQQVDVQHKQVVLEDSTIKYDELIIATGCTTNFFNNSDLERHALPMKSTQEALAIRNKLFELFEKKSRIQNIEHEPLNLVIVGAGPTGVELAGALAEMKRKILPKDYPTTDFSQLSIYLIEGSNHTLNAMGEMSHKHSRKYLEDLGVIIKTATSVLSYDGKTVELKDQGNINSEFVIWAAGIKPNSVNGLEEATVVRGRYQVNRFNQLVDFESIYALGDVAYMETENYPNGHPQLANVAINQGKNLAQNFKRIERQKALKPFEYKDLGTMATIGKHKAVVELPFVKFHGFFAWIVWMSLHLMLILSVRNKIIIFFNWAWSYIIGDSTLRLILSSKKSD